MCGQTYRRIEANVVEKMTLFDFWFECWGFFPPPRSGSSVHFKKFKTGMLCPPSVPAGFPKRRRKVI